MPVKKDSIQKDAPKNAEETRKDYKIGKGKPPKGTPFTSENQPDNPGRKTSLLKKWIKDNGISIQDVRLVMKGIIMDNNIDDLKKIGDDPTESMLTRTIIKAYLKDFEAGRIDTLNSILDRVYGKANQDINLSGEFTTVTITAKERADRIAQLKKELEE